MRTKKRRFRRLAMALLPAAFILVLASPDRAVNRQEDLSKFGGLLRLQGYPRLDPPRLDPAQGNWIFITQHIFDGLIRMDSSLNIAPDLAEYWQASNGGKMYTFFLRKGVRFHNGRELTASDVKFSFERLLRPETHSPYAQFFVSKVVGAQAFYEGRAPEVTGFQALSRYMFVIYWRNPSLAAPALLSMNFAKILPREQVLAQGQDFFFRPVGTGAFKFAYWMRDPRLEIVGVRLERNPAYFGRKPYLEAIEYSPHFTLDQFRAGEVDVVPYLWDGLARTGCQVLQGGPLNITYLMMSCSVPPFDRARIRRALALAIDKEKLAQAIASSAYIRRPTANFIPAALPGFFPVDTGPEPDPEQTRRILEEEGFFYDKKFPRIALYIESPRNEEDTRFYRELERQLKAVGLTLDLVFYRNLEELRSVRRPYFVKVEWEMDFPDPENIVQPLFAGSTTLNRFANGYANADLLALLRNAEVEPSLTRRQEMFQEMQRLLTKDMPAIPLFSSEQRIAVQPYVRGAKVPVMGLFYLNAKEIWLDRKE